MKNYYRLMLGRKSIHAEECFAGNFIGINDDTGDLTGQLPNNWRAFNAKFVPILRQKFPDKSKIALGLACGFVWTVCRNAPPTLDDAKRSPPPFIDHYNQVRLTAPSAISLQPIACQPDRTLAATEPLGIGMSVSQLTHRRSDAQPCVASSLITKKPGWRNWQTHQT